MISEDVIKQLADSAGSHRYRASYHRLLCGDSGATLSGIYARLMEASEALAVEYDQVAEFCRLLNADFRLRDALAEARWRALADGKSCHECAEPARVFQEDRWLCVPCYDVANAVNLVPTDEPDLAPSDAQDDEAREVTL